MDEAPYVYDDTRATVLYVALRLGSPLLMEGLPAQARPRWPRGWPGIFAQCPDHGGGLSHGALQRAAGAGVGLREGDLKSTRLSQKIPEKCLTFFSAGGIIFTVISHEGVASTPPGVQQVNILACGLACFQMRDSCAAQRKGALGIGIPRYTTQARPEGLRLGLF